MAGIYILCHLLMKFVPNSSSSNIQDDHVMLKEKSTKIQPYLQNHQHCCTSPPHGWYFLPIPCTIFPELSSLSFHALVVYLSRFSRDFHGFVHLQEVFAPSLIIKKITFCKILCTTLMITFMPCVITYRHIELWMILHQLLTISPAFQQRPFFRALGPLYCYAIQILTIVEFNSVRFLWDILYTVVFMTFHFFPNLHLISKHSRQCLRKRLINGQSSFVEIILLLAFHY